MSKIVAKRESKGARTRKAGHASRIAMPEPDSRIREFPGDPGLFDLLMEAAEQAGLLKDKSSRIAGRVSPALIEQAKRRTGIESDTDLIEFALANVAWRTISPRRSRLPTARWTRT